MKEMLYMKCGGYVGNIFVLMAKYGIEERKLLSVKTFNCFSCVPSERGFNHDICLTEHSYVNQKSLNELHSVTTA